MSTWTLLGIDPTQDKSAIRRAYARQLKRLGAERDADAFHRLRDAREAALRAAQTPPRSRPSIAPLPIDENETKEEASDLVRPREMEAGPRLKIVETEILDEEDAYHPLLGDERHLGRDVEDLTSQLSECLGGSADAICVQPILARIADLPLGPRRETERFCLMQAASSLTKADGTVDLKGTLRIKPFVFACDDAFGWSFDDEIVHESLTSRDAETLLMMLDSREPAPTTVRRSFAARLRRFDAQILLEGTPRLLSIYKAAATGGATPWRLNVWAAVAPHLWALYHRYWAVAAGWYLAGAGIALAVLAMRPGDRGLIALSGVASCCLGLAAGYLADRTVFLYGWRAARTADRHGLYEPAARKLFLRKRVSTINAGILIYLTLITAYLSMLPYFGLARWFGVLR